MTSLTMMQPVDFPALTLDAAIQLDLIEKHKSADLEVIACLGRYLTSPTGRNKSADVFALSENPVNVEILSCAFRRADGARLAKMGDLQIEVRKLIQNIDAVGSGATKDTGVVTGLKRFCLALHRVLLNELAPAPEDEWMPVHDVQFA